MTSSVNVLFVGDLHLGRQPSRLPETLPGRGQDYGPAAAWSALVDRAMDQQIHAVVLAGDVVERENDFFEAYRQLQAGVSRLAGAGIRVLGVVGNHDVAVLPRLADHIQEFELLGREGQWQHQTITAGDEILHLWGWSFPRPRVTSSPLADHVFQRKPGGPNLGVLHCDLDQPGSVYAPVTTRELESSGLDGWMLGHIHRPDPLAAPNPSGYLGSVTGLHPGEQGHRGPWLIKVRAGRIESADQWTMAPLRYARLDLDLTDLTGPEEARDRLLGRLKSLDEELLTLDTPPKAAGLRIRLTGRSRHGGAVRELFSPEDRAHVFTGRQDTHYFIERIISDTRPELELQALAQEPSPPGLLARRLLLLEEPDGHPDRQEMIRKAQGRLAQRNGESRWAELNVNPPDQAETVNYLRESGLQLLETLLAHREEGS